MNRRDFIKNSSIVGLSVPMLPLVKNSLLGKFGLVDAGKNIGPHKNVYAVLDGKKFKYREKATSIYDLPVTAANDIEGWVETLTIVKENGKKVCGHTRTRHYGNVEIRRLRT